MGVPNFIFAKMNVCVFFSTLNCGGESQLSSTIEHRNAGSILLSTYRRGQLIEEVNSSKRPEREFFIDNLLVRIEMIRWTGLAPSEFGFSFPGGRISNFLETKAICSSGHLSAVVNLSTAAT